MKGQQLHDFLFELYDFADTVAGLIQPETQDSAGAREQTHYDNAKYFLTLVYIEWIFDKYGRQLISRSAAESGALDARASLSEAHRRIDLLRQHIDRLTHEYDFDADVDRALDKLATEWRTAERSSATPPSADGHPRTQ